MRLPKRSFTVSPRSVKPDAPGLFDTPPNTTSLDAVNTINITKTATKTATKTVINVAAQTTDIMDAIMNAGSMKDKNELNEARPAAAGRAKMRTGREGLSHTVAAAASLLAEGDMAHAGIASDARDLLLDDIEPDALQPRRHFADADLKALAEDIARRGILQPILVRPPAQPGEPYRLVAGERRWRAARLAGKVRIPARVRALTDDEVQAAQLAENVLRAELTDIEKGRALRRLYEIRKASNHKTTWEDIAGEVGLGRSRIHDLFHLAALPEAVAEMIEAGRLSGSHGILLQRAGETLGSDEVIALAEQSARAENRRTGGYRMSVAQLRQTIQVRSSLIEQAVRERENGGADVTFAADDTLRENDADAPDISEAGEASSLFHAMRSLRPTVRQVVEELEQNTLSEVELSALFMALERVRSSRQHKGLPRLPASSTSSAHTRGKATTQAV